jgi:hypothetical protein
VSSKSNPQQIPSRAAKRARFSEQESKKTGKVPPLVLIGALVAILALAGGTALALSRPAPAATETQANAPLPELESYRTGSQGLLVKAATEGHDPYPLITAENGTVRLPLSTFDDYQAHYYTFMYQGRPIEFFVLKSKDGVVRAAFNACDVCFPAKKGYRQEGDEMVCNNCGSRFPAAKINEVRGGCNPSPLERTVDNGTLVIQEQDIIAGLSYF